MAALRVDRTTANLLLKLQRVDASIDSLLLQLEKAPMLERLRELEKIVKKLEIELSDREREISELNNSQSKLEQEMAALERKAEELEAQLFGGEVRSSRELMTLQHELETLKASKSSVEATLLDVMVRLEEVGAASLELEDNLRITGEQLASLRETWEKESSEIQQQITRLRREREPIANAIPPTLVEAYERLKAHMGGVAVARLEGAKCSGCNVDLSKAALEEIIRGEEDIPRCENCGRIILEAS